MEEFYDMPWCEYLIKCQAWQRIEKEKWRHTRLIAFESKIGSHLNPKSLPRTIENYLPLDGKRKRKVSNEIRELYERRIAEYNEAKAKQPKVVNLKSKKE
jgi:hypothetical protein